MPTVTSQNWTSQNWMSQGESTFFLPATTTNGGYVWPAWNGTYTGTSTTTTAAISDSAWANWNQATTTGWLVLAEPSRSVESEQQRADRLDAIEAVRFRRDMEFKENARRDEQARERAKELLLAHLDARQKRDVLEHNWFEVISDKGRRWRIRMDGHVGNVDLMPKEGEVRDASYCAHGPGVLPHADHHLAQKLVLETDEGAFLRVANEHYRRHSSAEVA